jgi:hypothetical protein
MTRRPEQRIAAGDEIVDEGDARRVDELGRYADLVAMPPPVWALARLLKSKVEGVERLARIAEARLFAAAFQQPIRRRVNSSLTGSESQSSGASRSGSRAGHGSAVTP